MIDMQALVDGIGSMMEKERANSQMTLGKMIRRLESLPGEMQITGLGSFDSYRGFYNDLAFEPSDKRRTVSEILTECKNALGTVFQGYKGGDYPMHSNTPLWIANYGECGVKIISINDDGSIVTQQTDDLINLHSCESNARRYEVKIESFEDLTDLEKFDSPSNGGGKECASYLRVTLGGKTVRVESDAMEPEDASFGRDLSWIKEALIEAYELGKRDK